jgi:predicted RND superfamily exporter protein
MERRLGALAAADFRNPLVALAISFVLLAGGAAAARSIRLSADLTELLPTTFESVKGLDQLKERFGGIGYVVVVGKGADDESLGRVADDLAPPREARPGIRYVD